MPTAHRAKIAIFPNVVLEPRTEGDTQEASNGAMAFFAGRLLPWKGVTLAIAAMEYLPGWKLTVIGSGPDLKRLRRHVARRRLAERITFIEWLPRDELLRMEHQANVLVFPSLREDVGWVVAEALAAGVPAVCIDRGGPPTLGATTVAASAPSVTARALATAVSNVRREVSAQSAFDIDSRYHALVRTLLHARIIAGDPEPPDADS
jgi:glycosyltransferase involved in cell wall biosynthesis